MSDSTGKKPIPVDHWTARAILEYAECEAAFGADSCLPTGPFAIDLSPAPSAAGIAAEVVADSSPKLDPAPKAQESVAAADLPAPLPAAEAPLPPVAERIAAIAKEIAACRACALASTRTNVVPGQGHMRPRLMFVGEAPGETEDRTGLAFVGPAGELLTKMMKAIGFERDDVFIANVLKCRPPDNRPPEPNEVEKCFHFLERQLAILSPEVICALGAHAATNLLGRSDPVGRLRGRVFSYGRSQLVVTYHPSYLLRSPEKKKDAWDDLKLVARLLGVTIPGAK